MASFTALYDACVLYPAPLRDLLMHLAMTDLFRARWTDQIHDEWIGNVLAKRPDLKRDQLERTRRLMNAHVLDCLVSGYENLIDGLALPDANDRHVLAAAIRAAADVIVTYNLDDFPKQTLDPLGIEAQHPDIFVARLLDLDGPAVCAAARRQRQSLRNPPKTVSEFLEILAQQHLPQTVAKLQEFGALLWAVTPGQWKVGGENSILSRKFGWEVCSSTRWLPYRSHSSRARSCRKLSNTRQSLR